MGVSPSPNCSFAPPFRVRSLIWTCEIAAWFSCRKASGSPLAAVRWPISRFRRKFFERASAVRKLCRRGDGVRVLRIGRVVQRDGDVVLVSEGGEPAGFGQRGHRGDRADAERFRLPEGDVDLFVE